MNTVYMVFVGLGDILDPMFLLITVACLWIKKKWKAKKSCRLVHMAEIDLHFQQSKSHVHEYFRPICQISLSAQVSLSSYPLGLDSRPWRIFPAMELTT